MNNPCKADKTILQNHILLGTLLVNLSMLVCIMVNMFVMKAALIGAKATIDATYDQQEYLTKELSDAKERMDSMSRKDTTKSDIIKGLNDRIDHLNKSATDREQDIIRMDASRQP